MKKIINVLKKGGIIIYPTETAYALGCDITNLKAIKKIYKLKKRIKKKKLTAIVSDITMAKKFGKISKHEEKLIKKFMPGPLTLIVPKKKKFPDLANTEFVFRISSNRTARKITRLLENPIISTSANLSGQKPIYNISKIKKQFEGKVNEIIDSGNLKKQKVSTIIKNGKIIRRGPIKKKDIEKVLK